MLFNPRLPPEIADRDCIEITVRDTGAGMSDDVLAHAFEPFFTTKESGKGSGLGLSQVYGLTQQSGGALRLDSSPGSGTAVRLFLPRSIESAEITLDRDERPDGPCPNGRIIVVDDEDAVREIAARMLRHSGYSVTEMSGGQAALDALARGEPCDLMLIDVSMPGLNGIETLRRARQTRPALAALLMTGYVPTEGLGLGDARDPLLKKPFSLADLANAVERTIESARRLGCASGEDIGGGKQRDHEDQRRAENIANNTFRAAGPRSRDRRFVSLRHHQSSKQPFPVNAPGRAFDPRRLTTRRSRRALALYSTSRAAPAHQRRLLRLVHTA